MKVRLLNAIAVASLGLSVVTAAMLVRSYLITDGFEISSKSRDGVWEEHADLCLEMGRGGVALYRNSYRFQPNTEPLLVTGTGSLHFTAPAAYPGAPHSSARPLCGFQFGDNFDSSDPLVMRDVWIIFPLWLPFTVFVACSTRCCWVWKKRNRQKPGCCVACGYDLRATPERCPECGVVSGSVGSPH